MDKWITIVCCIGLFLICLRLVQIEEKNWQEDKYWFRCHYWITEQYETVLVTVKKHRYVCTTKSVTRTEFKWIPLSE